MVDLLITYYIYVVHDRMREVVLTNAWLPIVNVVRLGLPMIKTDIIESYYEIRSSCYYKKIIVQL